MLEDMGNTLPITGGELCYQYGRRIGLSPTDARKCAAQLRSSRDAVEPPELAGNKPAVTPKGKKEGKKVTIKKSDHKNSPPARRQAAKNTKKAFQESEEEDSDDEDFQEQGMLFVV